MSDEIHREVRDANRERQLTPEQEGREAGKRFGEKLKEIFSPLHQPTPAYYDKPVPPGPLDIYAICRLYECEDAPLFHAVKKILRAGRGSGGKSKQQDVAEARDALNRWLEMEARPDSTPVQ